MKHQSLSIMNKRMLLTQQARSYLSGLQDSKLVQLLEGYSLILGQPLSKSVKQISYKCYQCSITLNKKKTNGYGRNQKESQSNCIKNILDNLIQQDKFLQSLPLHNDIKDNYSSVQQPKNYKGQQQQLAQNKRYIEHLQRKVQQLAQQNKKLRKEIKQIKQNNKDDKENRQTRKILAQYQSLNYTANKPSIKSYQQSVFEQSCDKKIISQAVMRSISFDINGKQKDKEKQNQVKRKVPLLNLNKLPNYHGKSTKSINAQLLSMWQKNHGPYPKA